MDIAQGVASLALGYVLIGLSARRFSNFFKVPCFYAFALSGRGYYIFVSHTQGAASLALGYALHWAFSPPRVPLALGWQRNAFLRRTANGRVYYYEDSRLICIFLSKPANI